MEKAEQRLQTAKEETILHKYVIPEEEPRRVD